MKQNGQAREPVSNGSTPSSMPSVSISPSDGLLRIAVEGCGHGTLDSIYASTEKASRERGWHGVDLLIICGDFQACRNQQDLNMTAMPEKFRKMADFHQYYYGQKTAPYLTIFVGGNHEASNHLFELYYGGWVAPNIYYMGAANVLRLGPLKIAAMSGIWKGVDYRKPHFERLPYNEATMRSIYHVRELDIRKLLSYRSQVDIGISHDWPQGIEWHGDHRRLFTQRSKWADDAKSGKLGNNAATMVMDRLRPPYWFSGHMHWKYTAVKNYSRETLAHRAQRKSEQSTMKTALAGWNSFSRGAARKDAEDVDIEYQTRLHQQAELRRTGQRPQVPYVLQETYKPVTIDDDMGRVNASAARNHAPLLASQVDGCTPSLVLKRSRESSSDTDGRREDLRQLQQIDGASETKVDPSKSDPHNVERTSNSGPTANAVSGHAVITNGHSAAFNPDAIDLESEDDTDEIPLPSHTEQRSNNSDRVRSITPPAAHGAVEVPGQDYSSTSCDISEEARAALASLSTTFAVAPKKSSDLPHPETITNKQVNFLALSKVEPGKEFLQLLEIAPVPNSEPDAARDQQKVTQPVKLAYDLEWLAILRVFAPELELDCASNPISTTSPVPPHLGDTHYRQRILEEEKWVEANVLRTHGLEIPENFEVTATRNSNWDERNPVECTNPQTSRFCDLIGIPNLFDISHEERQARMNAGPPTEQAWTKRPGNPSPYNNGGGGARGGGRFGTGRGNVRGRGRGRTTRGRW